MQPIVVAFDGSEPAKQAVRRAAELFADRPLVVVSVWSSIEEVAGAGRAALPQSIIDAGVANIDEAARVAAQEQADEGVRLAAEQGADATAVALRGSPSVWPAIVSFARERAAAVVVVGSRGRSNLASVFLGSVSSGVVHHCGLPVLVVHPLGDG